MSKKFRDVTLYDRPQRVLRIFEVLRLKSPRFSESSVFSVIKRRNDEIDVVAVVVVGHGSGISRKKGYTSESCWYDKGVCYVFICLHFTFHPDSFRFKKNSRLESSEALR